MKTAVYVNETELEIEQNAAVTMIIARNVEIYCLLVELLVAQAFRGITDCFKKLSVSKRYLRNSEMEQ